MMNSLQALRRGWSLSIVEKLDIVVFMSNTMEVNGQTVVQDYLLWQHIMIFFLIKVKKAFIMIVKGVI